MFRSTTAATVMAAGLALGLAPMAGAGAPVRGCPPPFTLLNYEGQIALAMKAFGLDRADAIEQFVQPAIDLVDRNGDTLLCFAFQNRANGTANVLDNVAATR